MFHNLLQISESVPEFDAEIAQEFGYQVAQGGSFLGVPIVDQTGLTHLLIRFVFNLLMSWILVRFLYYPRSRRRDYMFTFLAFSSSMFLLIFLLESVKLEIGLTLGLFAIFGVIRYRTETVPVREMTYLFIIIAMSVINGLSLNISYAELFAANALILLLCWVTESIKGKKHQGCKLVQYDKIELITTEKREELIADLSARLGVQVTGVEVGSVDFLKDSALLKVFYRSDATSSADQMDKYRPAADQ